VRFFHWELGKLGRIDPKTAHHNKGYRATAAFLAYLVERYDTDLVRKLNRALREGRYEEGVFERLAGKTVQELDDKWRATLR
jgi:Peptidase of plants and bacteria